MVLGEMILGWNVYRVNENLSSIYDQRCKNLYCIAIY